MDVSFNNVLEGTRQYFMGLPTASSQSQGGGQPTWAGGGPPRTDDEGSPAHSRPPSTAPPRPPSEPIEPEPHIIHKATVMREALEKRRERPDDDDDDRDDQSGALSPPPPPSHVVHRPPEQRHDDRPPAEPALRPLDSPRGTPDSPASPAFRPPHRPRSAVDPRESGRSPAPRPAYPYATSRQPDSMYTRYVYDGGDAGRAPGASPQPAASPARYSPQIAHARISSSTPHLQAAALTRYVSPAAPPPHNDRVPPIHHPPPDPRPAPPPQLYQPHRRVSESSQYSRAQAHYERAAAAAAAPRKYDTQHAYPGYRPAASVAHFSYKHVVDAAVTQAAQYGSRPPDRARPPDQARPLDSARLAPRTDYVAAARTADDTVARLHARPNYMYVSPSTSAPRYAQNASVPAAAIQTAAQPARRISPQRPPTTYRPSPAPKSSYEYAGSAPSHTQTSPVRPLPKGGFASQQTRMTVSVTSLVNQMNQTKQKRESPLDLSVKTVKNSADSSTTQEDADSSSTEIKNVPLQPRPTSSAARLPSGVAIAASYVASHKVDFAPDFHSQYRERRENHLHAAVAATLPPPARHNGSYEVRPQADSYRVDPRHPAYIDHNKYNLNAARHEPVPRIDLTKSQREERRIESRLREERHYLEESRKRQGGAISSNVPDKLVRYETWSSDSRIERLNRSAREQHVLMSQPVYSYSSYKRFEALQNEQKRVAAAATATSAYRENIPNNRYPYVTDLPQRNTSDYHNHYLDRTHLMNGRQVIQRVVNSRDPSHHLEHHSGVPADKRVLSILRNSLETKHTGTVEAPRLARQELDLIVIDDDTEITDLTKDNDTGVISKSANFDSVRQLSPNIIQKIHVPKAVDSIVNDNEYQKLDNNDTLGKSPENDVSSRIRTKAELKVMPPSEEHSLKLDFKQENEFSDKPKILPKSQKQHLFNQIREDRLRQGSGKEESNDMVLVTQIKSEPMNIDEIEKDAELTTKDEESPILENKEITISDSNNEDDMDWANACENFVEQLKTSCHKKKLKKPEKEQEHDNQISDEPILQESLAETTNSVVIKQEPITEDELKDNVQEEPTDPVISEKKVDDIVHNKSNDVDDLDEIPIMQIKKEIESKASEKVQIKEEAESTDDDEPLIKSKLLKDREKNEQHKNYQILKELAEKSVYVKLECCDADVNKKDTNMKENENKVKSKVKNSIKGKGKASLSEQKSKIIKTIVSSSDSDSDDVSVASRLRTRKINKSEDIKPLINNKSPLKTSTPKKMDSPGRNTSTNRKLFETTFDFHPGWEEELYRYKRSLRMPPRLIAIPRGRSDGPFGQSSSSLFTRGSTSLPDLDHTPLSPAPSSAPSAATDDLFSRRLDKNILDSDLDSNSSCSVINKLHYDSEASTSTILSSVPVAKKKESIIDVLMQKCSKTEIKRKKFKEQPKIKSKSPRSSNLLHSPNLKLADKKKDKIEDDIHLGDLKKKILLKNKTTNTKNSSPQVEKRTLAKLKARTKTENRQLKQRTNVKGSEDNRPASAPAASLVREDVENSVTTTDKDETVKLKAKAKKIMKDKLLRRSNSIRDGLRSTKSLKRNDAKGRLLRLKKRNNLIKSLANKRIKDFPSKKKESKSPSTEKDGDKTKEEAPPVPTDGTRKRFKRLFGRRKFSSGFDYIRKKKKIVRKDETTQPNTNKIKKVAVKNSPESEHDTLKEIKGWFINKSIGETSLHRAARLGYTVSIYHLFYFVT